MSWSYIKIKTETNINLKEWNLALFGVVSKTRLKLHHLEIHLKHTVELQTLNEIVQNRPILVLNIMEDPRQRIYETWDYTLLQAHRNSKEPMPRKS